MGCVFSFVRECVLYIVNASFVFLRYLKTNFTDFLFFFFSYAPIQSPWWTALKRSKTSSEEGLRAF
jgi:hypothetical protein